jgi:tRNA A-37 threonylcarbamoyl transferase component Bud32
MRIADLPPGPCRAIPRVLAKKTRVAPTRNAEESLNSIQGEVITEHGVATYFKPQMDMRGPEFERELLVLSRMNELDLRPSIRVPNLEGLVASGNNGETTMGMLLTLIMSEKDLRDSQLQSKIEFHEKWKEQVTSMVQELHAHDIVWGDVNPSNVMIGDKTDAWLIDFGGMNNVEFVDEDIRETIEGDKQV